MSKTRINYKSDFSLDVTFAINRAPVSLPVNDFLVRFFVDGAPGTDYVCGYKGGEYISCEKKDDDTLTCYLDNHKFGCGRLCCEFVDLENNEKFTDKIQKTVTPSRLDVVLVEGPGDASTSVSASVMVDIEAVISGLRDALDDIEEMQDNIEDLQGDVSDLETALEGKLDYYDASWIHRASQRTVENFNALKDASLAQKVVVAKDNIYVSDAETFENKVILSSFREGGYDRIVVSLVEGVVGVSYYFIVYAESAVVDALGERVTSAEGDITTLGGRVTSVETWQTQAGNAASLPHYHSANWLENEQGSYSEDYPERRLKVRYTAMMSAINDNRLIKLFNVTASGVSVNDGVISAVFMTTNSNGTSQTVRYYVRYTSGNDYCTVEKKEIPMPYYDATWATTYGGSLENLEEFINVINSTPRALMLVESQPVVWAARRTPYMVQFAVMIDGGMRTYTTQYDSDAGETYCSYEDTIFQST